MKYGVKRLQCLLLIVVIALQILLPACAEKKEDITLQDVETQPPATQETSVPATETTTAEHTTQEVTTAGVGNGNTFTAAHESTTAEAETTGAAVNPEMQKLMGELGSIVELCGFEYDAENDLFYSTMYPIQRAFGFNSLYDLMAYRVGMYYNTQKIYFKYGGKDWMLQLWKGQYGITVGAEIGLYNKPSERLLTHYDCIDDDEMIVMQFDVYKNGEYYFSRGPERHWWLTGFKLLDVAVFLQLTMVATLCWESDGIADAFEKGINDFHITDMEYIRSGNTFTIKWKI